MSEVLTITTCANAKDGTATTVTLDKKDFIDILVNTPPNEGDEKEMGEAWSPAVYSNGRRLKDQLVNLSCIALDFDKGKDGRAGLTEDEIVAIEDKLSGYEYLLHTTYSSGSVHPRLKFRIVMFLSRNVLASEYEALWKILATTLPVAPDPAAKAASRIHFLPRVPVGEAHLFRAGYQQGEPLDVDYLLGARPLKGVNEARVRAITDPYDHVRLATTKHVALVEAAFKVGCQAAEQGLDEPDYANEWSKFRAALSENKVSDPVKDWSAAEKTCRVSLRDGFNKASKATAGDVSSKAFKASPKQQLAAANELKRLVKLGFPTLEKVQDAAYNMGRYVPHVLDEITVREAVETAALKGLQLSRPEVELSVSAGLAKGMTKPKFIHTGWRALLKPSSEGDGFLASEENASLLLSKHPDMEGVLGRDVRSGGLIVRSTPPWTSSYTTFPVRLQDHDWLEVANWINKELKCSSSIGRQRTLTALQDVAQENQFDPFKDWLESLEWDGIERLDNWLVEVCGVPPSTYYSLAGRKWLMSAAARTLMPGCRAQYVLVFTGNQGLEKSYMLQALAGDEYFSDDIGEIGTPDASIATERLVIVELSELVGFAKKDQETIKRFLTATKEEIRRPYAREAQRVTRRAIFAGTTNQRDFLRDKTGGRRFWPVACQGFFNVDWVKANRTQLWAEAIHRVRGGEPWWMDREEEKLAQQKQYEHTEIDELMFRLDILTGKVTSAELEILEDQINPETGLLKWATISQCYHITGLKESGWVDQRRLIDLLHWKGWKKGIIKSRDRTLRIVRWS